MTRLSSRKLATILPNLCQAFANSFQQIFVQRTSTVATKSQGIKIDHYVQRLNRMCRVPAAELLKYLREILPSGRRLHNCGGRE